jgi:hypothetical protein
VHAKVTLVTLEGERVRNHIENTSAALRASVRPVLTRLPVLTRRPCTAGRAVIYVNPNSSAADLRGLKGNAYELLGGFEQSVQVDQLSGRRSFVGPHPAPGG